jgi:carbamoyl-phosphate synthase small subunit
MSEFESNDIQIAGLIVSQVSREYSHWNATSSLSEWLSSAGVPGLSAVDTRALTKRLWDKGSMLGKILVGDQELEFRDPNKENLVSQVSTNEPLEYPAGITRVVVVDCGCKSSIIRSLLARGLTAVRVPLGLQLA